jgi:hypothetical protein
LTKKKRQGNVSDSRSRLFFIWFLKERELKGGKKLEKTKDTTKVRVMSFGESNEMERKGETGRRWMRIKNRPRQTDQQCFCCGKLWKQKMNQTTKVKAE